MSSLRNLRENLPYIEDKIGYSFERKDLLVLAFVHRSFINEFRGGRLEHNERLEFLGDSVLGLAVADFLYHRLPDYPEGQLSQIRSRLVDTGACSQYLLKLQLAEYILLGRGEAMSEGRAKQSILADVFEALLGAIYVDGHMNRARSFLLMHFERDFESAIGTPSRNYKAELQDYSQKQFQKPPIYKVMDEVGPDHAKVFHVMVYVNEQEAGLGIGSSKKEAEQQAAFVALVKAGL
ncbi:MAG: ribonuclease III [Chlamydiae bacterium RIFCSPHIGHO2_12_FULL_44_59]|nr:MAG: ribonuclease III [Chlamydiae bacterium RIFCSPHIGHO2_01_FULL_44_39]OGN58415.1 MAG: ribonuclease III [Chlamydiae bacterium RIFCSPHIGHO2_02_FULL_45_9]OGN59466.1 MAG: ribonuclease III [Chlamydiae bacterium RIFCSPHIGHO2_12_FULL_44_59]OGN67219.1 MAG: ribonuclease III [Chlamydiae bacterium RIFCSPLOWO2_01_FULL_44_52]OGN67416.1 MAG: ribonuclease III [Chlamydiae bacterium RIFCSPLOWO2_02_FULL_45_22]OGN69148.1 MAG: ribonuclease III [Chlamydiae bacterium RIFCSPLOWO2_12_FULL_45_20]